MRQRERQPPGFSWESGAAHSCAHVYVHIRDGAKRFRGILHTAEIVVTLLRMSVFLFFVGLVEPMNKARRSFVSVL